LKFSPQSEKIKEDEMIKVRPAGERGKTQTSWLDSNHTFSFNRYYDPRYTGFRDLLVINEDFVAPGQGFGTHSHRDMEILSYIVEGALEHRDSSGGSGVIRPGELQRMSAGTGVSHSEFNSSQTEPVHFLQIWIQPDREGITPEYEQRSFQEGERRGRLRLIASRDGGGGALTIHQDVKVYDALLASGDQISHQLDSNRHAWIQVVKGMVKVNDTLLRAGDGAAVSQEESLNIRADASAEILLFDLS
jgi:redox-sensitive bicupin YhaK (pirin superfamily)